MELDEAKIDINKAYLDAVVQIMAMEGFKEINFWKTSIVTPDGGVYILQLQHVNGPKIQLPVIDRTVQDICDAHGSLLERVKSECGLNTFEAASYCCLHHDLYDANFISFCEGIIADESPQ